MKVCRSSSSCFLQYCLSIAKVRDKPKASWIFFDICSLLYKEGFLFVFGSSLLDFKLKVVA